jgi:redox-sensitive bicupin YhaK (pirin superfamily)
MMAGKRTGNGQIRTDVGDMKKDIVSVHESPQGHWVGDGFPVRSLFTYDNHGRNLSPFLLLDYAGPAQFAPASRARGVGEHPHRGFETVTIVYAGEVAHRDSVGNGGLIGPGDVQWMTAASGILHEEFHSPEFTRRGGAFELAQLWVNLPAEHKMSAPRYQTIVSGDIPEVALSRGAGRVRVIAGAYRGQSGPAATFSELNVWDVRLAAGGSALLEIPEGHNAAVALLRGSLTVDEVKPVGEAELLLLSRRGDEIHIEAGAAGATLLLLSGVPIAEPVVGYGPFVMNSRQEIETAMNDFRLGKFGSMPAPAAAPLETAGV